MLGMVLVMARILRNWLKILMGTAAAWKGSNGRCPTERLGSRSCRAFPNARPARFGMRRAAARLLSHTSIVHSHTQDLGEKTACAFAWGVCMDVCMGHAHGLFPGCRQASGIGRC
eukprot:362110-Chlamydomonas_euryale.AAC.12